MKIGLIWIGYGIAVIGVSFGTGNGDSAAVVGIIGALCAAVVTIFVICAENK